VLKTLVVGFDGICCSRTGTQLDTIFYDHCVRPVLE
jgi:hypothetical protein